MLPMLRRLLALLALLSLAACGFHLRGLGQTTPLAFASLRIDGGGPLSDMLQRQLSLRSDLQLVGQGEAAGVLTLENERVEKQVLTVNRNAQATEYELVYRIQFRFRQDGNERIGPTVLTLRRDYSFDPNNLLGKDAEEQLLIRDMRSDVAQQIIRRLAAIKPVTVPEAAPAAIEPAAPSVPNPPVLQPVTPQPSVPLAR
ncbi:LPS-assembly lipoprotein LptE [Chitinimonas koreensis]|uniref:LPS-assembly lipoprotein LptE n=1 Tax=Chitinimonas koreensis TaxID=356302 RepID=UPI0009FEED16|nr:LPS assembly lipoprotein LptE [Chitinimonas koreensis]QNM96823.1 hypothetical protein H9L41_00215 [Chitinimonas koreensis]